MSVFNGSADLGQAVDSILAQTFHEFEFIIIDDASEDDSLAILQEYAKKDSRIRLIKNKKNKKLAASLNAGIKQAKGEFIARMDADDVALPERLQKQYDFMTMNQHIAVCGTWVSVYESPKIIWKTAVTPEAANCAAFFESCFHHPTVMIRKSVLDQYGSYDETIEFAQDCHLWSRLAFEHDTKFANLPDALLRYRSHPQKKRKDYRVRQYKNASLLRNKNLQRMGVSISENQQKWHDILCTGALLQDKQAFTALLEWIRELEQYNQKSGLLEPQAFKYELSQKLLRVCLASAAETLAAPMVYMRYCKFRDLAKNSYRVLRMVVMYVSPSVKDAGQVNS